MTAKDFGKAGVYKCVVATVNDYDGNLTEGKSLINIDLDGKISGSIDYSAGTNYNEAEAAPIEGAHVGKDGLDLEKWTRFQDDHTVYWAEKYHGGNSDFYYSGKFEESGKLTGTYKMGGRNATGTFTWTFIEWVKLEK